MPRERRPAGKGPAGLGIARMLLALACSALAAQALAGDEPWRQERWVVEDFTDALGTGPVGGPAAQAGGEVFSLCGDSKGRLFLASGQFIDIVTPEGMRAHLAGSGQLGYRDGPADQAQFRLGLDAYYGAHNLACGANGVFVADGGNGRVRRIHETDGQWRVDTWAGGGERKLEPGESAPARAVNFRGTIAVAATGGGELTVADSHGYYRIGADGEAATFVGLWPQSMSKNPRKPPWLNPMTGDADRLGRAYFVSRTPDFVVRIDPDGSAVHLAGRLVDRSKRLKIGDGPPREAFFDTPNSMAAQPDGSAVYVCGGDEYDIRRVPADGEGTTATLMQNGRWGIAPIHPNRARGPAVFRPEASGRLQPEGELTDLMVTRLVGRDAEGNLYGSLFHWVGMTQEVEGRGLLGTHVFRLRRLTEGADR